MKTVEIDAFISNLDNINNIDFTDECEKAALSIENAAKLKCPVDTGALRRSIKAETIEKNRVVVGTDVKYAKFIEYGTGIYEVNGNGRKDAWAYKDDEEKWHTTKGMKPQPFMEPAIYENEQFFKDLIKNKLMEELTK